MTAPPLAEPLPPLDGLSQDQATGWACAWCDHAMLPGMRRLDPGDDENNAGLELWACDPPCEAAP
ncbi:hypothetical protein [Streptomyces sp. SBT349]|uniref:hypothetical protein n=1 Tax=Streptomyces sp. SBT349 TaxID=1580539 RepID=UPI00066DD2FB|nr:hypothetical protein [Streptomyces sp. SBT349]